MPTDEENTRREIGPIRRIPLGIAGVDLELMKIAPRRDENTMIAKVLLLVLAATLMAAELSIISHQIFVDDGTIHVELIAGSMFIAFMVAQLDAFIFLRAAFEAGLAELRRAGLQFGSEFNDKGRKIASIGVRLLLSAAIALLTSLGACLIIYKPEITSEIDRAYRTENAAVIAKAEKQTDDKIERMTASTKLQESHVDALRKQVIGMRDGAVNPTSDPSVDAEQQKVAQLLTAKQQRDAELAATQTRAADELAGIKSDDSSGIPGRGPRRIAAEERVKQAQVAADNAGTSLTEEQGRLDELRGRLAASSGDRSRQAQMQLPRLEQDLAAESSHLEAMRSELHQMIAHRDADVRAAVENAPEHIRRNKGLLTQLEALGRIAAQSPEIEAVIMLIDITAMALEGCFVIATSVAYIPTTYSALLARDHIVRLMRIVEDVAQGLGSPGDGTMLPTEITLKGKPIVLEVANDNVLNGDPSFSDQTDEFSQDDTPPDPPRRGRGRPPKSSIN
jgi:hypothetical protein